MTGHLHTEGVKKKHQNAVKRRSLDIHFNAQSTVKVYMVLYVSNFMPIILSV